METFDTNWDVEKYRTEYESDEHWLLKCAFIKAHKDRFSEEELICLAQVFFNIEFLGCKYPTETMKLVAELSKDVAKEFRESRKGRLQRTFVTASDAIETKYREKMQTKNDTSTTRTKISFIPESTSTNEYVNSRTKITFQSNSSDEEHNNITKSDLKECINPRKKTMKFQSESCDEENDDITEPNTKIIKTDSIIELNDINFKRIFQNFIIYESDSSSANILSCSASKNGFIFSIETKSKTKFNVILNNLCIASNQSKIEACTEALNKLKKYCYTIKVKAKFFSKSDEILKNDLKDSLKSSASDKIDSNNMGFKLLKALGWSGGGLGTKNTGIIEPIEGNYKIGRSGFGHESSNQFNVNQIKNLLIEYKKGNDMCDLIFSNEFSKEERAKIHMMAKQNKLKSQSYGKDEDRHLVVSRYKSIKELFDDIKSNKDPGLLEKYEILPPEFHE